MDQSLNTKKLLGDTLIELMSEKPFDKITVSELTKRCNLNRQTFYYHFETIIDLFEWVLAQEAGPLLEQFKGNPLEWNQAIQQILYFMKENSAAVLCALHSIENQQIRAFFISYFSQAFSGLFDYICQGLDIDPEFKEFMIKLHITSATALALQWLESGMKESPEQLAEWLSIYSGNNMREAFERYAEARKNGNLQY